MKKTNIKTKIIAAVLAVISTFSMTAFAATSVSAAETTGKATAAQSDDGRSLERGNLHNYTLYIQ